MIETTIYEKNLESLKGRYNHIIEKLKTIPEDKVKLDVFDAKDGSKALRYKYENKELYIHSKYSPKKEAEDWVDSINMKEKKVFLVFGLGLGYHIEELMSKLDDVGKIFIIEPSIDIFRAAITHIDLTEIIQSKKVYLMIHSNQEEINNVLWRFTNWGEVTKIDYRYLTNYKKIFYDEYKSFLKVVLDLIHSRVLDKNTVFFFANQWQENMLNNLPYIFESNPINSLYGAFKNKPAIIVSAGPSLSKNIHLLKEIKEHAVIISVGTALKALLKENIKPDFVIAVDGSIKNYKHFDGIDYSDIPFVYTPIVHSDIVKDHKGEKFVFLTREKHIISMLSKLNMESGSLNTGNSVANSAFDLAVKMGADPVIFVGQDLAYTDNKTHATGTVYENDRVQEDNKKYFYVEDIYGQPILTDRSLYAFQTWFEIMIENDKSARTYIDATEGGAKIKGTQIMTLQALKEKYLTENIHVTEELHQIFNKRKRLTKEQYQEIISEYKEIKAEFKEVNKLSTKASDISTDLYELYKQDNYNDVELIKEKVKELDEIDLEIRERIERFSMLEYFLQPIMYNVFNIFNAGDDEDEKQKGLRISLKSKFMYKGFKEGTDYIEPLMKNMIKRIEDVSQIG